MIKPTIKMKFAFFDTQAVKSRLDPATRKFLGWAGGLTMKVSRRSLRRGRQKKLSEMTQKEIDAYQKRVDKAKEMGRDKPRRPEVSSEPGQPPKLHSDKSPLKHLIYYGLELETENTVIGPYRSGSGIAGTLEHGGTTPSGKRIEPRPFMGRALEIVTPQLPGYWDNLLNK